jgi:hypothetical protein
MLDEGIEYENRLAYQRRLEMRCGGGQDAPPPNAPEPEPAQPETYEIGESIPHGALNITVEGVRKLETTYGSDIPPDRELAIDVLAEGEGEFLESDLSVRFPDGSTLTALEDYSGNSAVIASPGRPVREEVSLMISVEGEPYPDFTGAELVLMGYGEGGQPTPSFIALPDELPSDTVAS